MKDPFQTLGVPSSASEEEIKSAYRRLAKQYHPDLHPGDKHAEEKMKEVNEAYAEAIRVKKNGGYRPDAYGDRPNTGYGGYGSGYGGGYGGGYGSYGGSQGGYGGSYGSQGSYGQGQRNPFEEFFGGSFNYGRQQSGYGYSQRTSARSGSYDDPELQRANDWIVAGRYQDALNLLNRMSAHGAAWHYLSALANLGLGNSIAAQNHARQAVQLDPENGEYRDLLNQLQGTSRTYQSSGGFGNIGSLICGNPCMAICAANMLLNCLCGGRVMCC